MMAFICVVSLAALLQFLVSYCGSLVAVYSTVELSPEARQFAGLKDQVPRGDEFHRLIRLATLYRSPTDDRVEIGAVRAYYSLLNLLHALGPLTRKVALWAEHERARCAYFAAVALDRRLAWESDGIT